MSRWSTDTETVLRRWLIGKYVDGYDGGLHALAAFSTADTTDHPEGVADA
jgi:hypothetical protein